MTREAGGRSEAEQQVAIWRERARLHRQENERLCRWAGELLDRAADADVQAEIWQRTVDERNRELAALADKEGP